MSTLPRKWHASLSLDENDPLNDVDLIAQKTQFTDKDKKIDAISAILTDFKICIHVEPELNNPLTLMEMSCLVLLARGKNPAQCADILYVSEASIIFYEKRIRQKLGAFNRTHALYLAVQHGYFKII